MSATPDATTRSSWGPTGLYSSVLIGLVVLLAALALNASPPSPPNIAEFAPQAQHQIKKAPLQQTSDVGSGKGGNGLGGLKPTPTPTVGVHASAAPSQRPIDTAQAHHCFGDPQRQILDTQSPPCISYWDGDNGGDLDPKHGITRTEIRIGYNPLGGDAPTRVMTDLELFFNRYFEFYHRQIKLVDMGKAPGGGSDACTTMKAWANQVAAMHVFAAMVPGGDGEECFPTQLAADHVVTVLGQGAAGWYTQPQMASFAPYLWEYAMAYDNYLDNMGRLFCAQLAHKKAAYSTESDLQSKTRSFGLIFWPQPGPFKFKGTALKNSLARCGVSLNEYDIDALGSDNQAQLDANNAVLAMKGNADPTCGSCATTVVCLCEPLAQQYVAAAADSNRYFPEWMLTWNNDVNADARLLWDNNNPQQRRALMGMAFRPKQVNYPDATLNWALAAVDPGFQVNVNSLGYQKDQVVYWNLLLIASGIQMAGAHLSAQSFQKGLQSTSFPNPWSPQEEGDVGFGGGSHSMTTDASVMWWSDTAPSMYADEGAGTWCYQAGGARYRGTSWSKAIMPPALTGGGFGGTCNPPPTPPG